MGAALFYHVTESSVAEVVVNLLGRALEQGWKIELRGTLPDRMHWYDRSLWEMGGAESFLPHGLAGRAQDALQPVLLTTASQPAKAGRDAVLSIDGAEVAPEELERHERVWILFDGHDHEALSRARVQWKQFTAAGAKAQYWSEESGRWQKKSESG
ncbi:DNA polymerase III subunit chi [Thioclava litoralis]|uniref:DNA polymerase III subunit chi n=1 Tax=Thioclava litoralis TaxID=3076557 RepID=A0ABZ1DXW9_9RHOB|nr:DNA polymerase III subunit chi [Thioclava sp. FTW29]